MASGMNDQKFIKSFTIFLVLGVVLTLFLIYLGNLNAGTITDRVRGERNAMAEAANSNALQPVGQINVASEGAEQAETVQVAAAATAIDGAGVYQSACMACHAAGVAGAPRVGDIAGWADRIAQGGDTLYTNAIQGFQGEAGMMPAKGGNMALSDGEVKAAVDHMVALSQ
ncbi:MAG: c-type cytochrome [Arenicellales bacterium]|jgi:cytochrome c5|nr:c-type cytochrome [Arenicellales bacterium]MDP6918710.1 c-type cytochrome [Arenicellales bacterium]|tara:strand:- start:11871 stop:12380 length:510 start_codon:yes stop_codon:yes gene_type:complete